MDDNDGEHIYVIVTGPGERAQERIGNILGNKCTQSDPQCLMWVWREAQDTDAIADVRDLVKFLQGRRIKRFRFCPVDEHGYSLPEKAQQLLGEFLVSSDCQIEKVNLTGVLAGSDVLRMLAKYLPNSKTSIRKLEFTNLSFETTERKTLIHQLLAEKQDFESIRFKSFKFDANDNDVSFLVDGLRVQKHLAHFCCGWSNHANSENWSKIIGNGIAPANKHSLSELEVYYPCPASEAALPKGLINLLEMPDSTVRRLRLPRFESQLDGVWKHHCSKVCQIVQKANITLQEVTLKEGDGFNKSISPVDADLEMLCQRNILFAETQALFVCNTVSEKEEFVELLAKLKEQPDDVGLLPIYTMFRAKPDLVSDSFFKCFLRSFKQKV